VSAAAGLAALALGLWATVASAQSTDLRDMRSRANQAIAATAVAAPAPASTFIDTPATVRTLQFDNPTLGLPLSRRTRIVYEPRPVRPWADTNAAASGAPAEARLGLEFRTVSATTGAKNLLRVQLSAVSALQFRPRGGGMTVAYKTQF
jgi:hypothetical protein